MYPIYSYIFGKGLIQGDWPALRGSSAPSSIVGNFG